MQIRERVKQGKISVIDAINELNKVGGNKSHTMQWLLRRKARTATKVTKK